MPLAGQPKIAPRHLDRRRVVIALAGALDLVGIDEVQHGKRVAVMAAGCAAEMSWEDERQEQLIEAALLHDCGVSSDREHRNLLDHLEWGNSQAHCRRGARYLEATPFLAHLAPAVLYHHTHWRVLQANHADLAPADAAMASLIFLCDRVDMLRAGGLDGDGIRRLVSREAGRMFDPRQVETFVSLSAAEAFWFALDPAVVESHVERLVRRGRPMDVDFDDLRAVAMMFAHIIDAKSPYTQKHSLGVARLARRLGERFDLPAETCDALELAGLLHDLGKLRIPDQILDKPEPLAPAERALVHRHSYDTWEILRQAFGDGPIAEWAAFHHETLSGHGYPFRRRAFDLAFEARIIAVADVIQALAQDRPYRPGFDVGRIGHELDRMVGAGHLDGGIVTAIRPHLADCRRIALGEG